MSSAPVPAPEAPFEPEPRPGRFRRIGNALANAWRSVRPGPETRAGSAWGALSGAAIIAFYFGISIRTGFGLVLDVPLALVAAALVAGLSALAVWLLMTVLRKLPRWSTGAFIGAVMVVGFRFPPAFGVAIGLAVALACGTLGATIATFRSSAYREASRGKKILTASLCVLALAGIAGMLAFARWEGTAEALVQPASGPLPAAIDAADPGRPGPFVVKTLTYGSGTDRRRPEFRDVAIKTATVDASALRKDLKGTKARLRRWYWGFDLDKAPLNGRVWYPVGPGPFPLVLVVHGNHNMADHSDPGYAYLGELLASRGFILASLDENFLNASFWSDLDEEKSARGWMLLEHLRQWRDWNAKPGTPFTGKVDMSSVALMGHSRGGEAAATAALFNRLGYLPEDATVRFPQYGFDIKSVVAIAPADGQYMPAGTRRQLQDVNYLVMQGGHDADVSSFLGSAQYDRVKFTGIGSWFKSALFVYRANHGQFNSVWGRYDYSAPFSRFINTRPLLAPEDQRRIAQVYISAFLEATLRGRSEYLPLFRDYRSGRDWLPDTLAVCRFEDATSRHIADFSEDVDVTTGTMTGSHIAAENFSTWKEGRIPRRQGDHNRNGVFLGWNRKTEKPVPVPLYTLSVPEGAGVGANSILAIALSATGDDPPVPKGAKERKEKDGAKPAPKNQAPDFTVELVDAAAHVAAFPLSRFGPLQPPLNVRFTKWKRIDDEAYKKPSEPILQTVEVPLTAAAGAVPGFDPTRLRTVRFRFNRSEKGSVVIAEIGLRDGAPRKPSGASQDGILKGSSRPLR